MCGKVGLEGHAWQGACIVGGHPGQRGHALWGACMAGDMATAANGTHPTVIHSCFLKYCYF